MTKYIAKSKVELVNLLDQAFPEFFSFFSSIYGKTPFSILEKANSLSSIVNLSKSRFTSLKALSHGSFTYSKYIKLKHAAKFSIGTHDNSHWTLIHTIIRRINFLQEEKVSVEHQIRDLMSLSPSPLMSIPGINLLTCAGIISEIGDINRFPNYRSLIAFAGLDNSVYQSGTELKLGKISKRGSIYLRTALYKASVSVVNHSELFYDYYFKKRSEGKHRTLALINVSRKLLRVSSNLLRFQSNFNDQFYH